jgi:hypothetical protein
MGSYRVAGTTGAEGTATLSSDGSKQLEASRSGVPRSLTRA